MGGQAGAGAAARGSVESSVQSSVEKPQATPLLRLLKAHPGLTARQAAEQLGLSQRAVEKQLAALKRQWPPAPHRAEQGWLLAGGGVSRCASEPPAVILSPAGMAITSAL
ncbi:winged helix-turn-helix domain-containing protein [Azotobacter chroococcum]|uniref:winged helix-turn-helix transcriptional regulator n=1 Tax=Azotobacter chroococcum TaxID=353 RepID=UPI001B8D0364